MRRRYGFYWSMLLFWTLATILVGVVLIGDTWWQLVLAALLGLAMAQLGFLGHEAAHPQVFASKRWNKWVARVLAGLFTEILFVGVRAFGHLASENTALAIAFRTRRPHSVRRIGSSSPTWIRSV